MVGPLLKFFVLGGPFCKTTYVNLTQFLDSDDKGPGGLAILVFATTPSVSKYKMF
jgi:hypothetical protein